MKFVIVAIIFKENKVAALVACPNCREWPIMLLNYICLTIHFG